MLAAQLTPLSPFFSHRFFFPAHDQFPCSSSASQDPGAVPYHLSACGETHTGLSAQRLFTQSLWEYLHNYTTYTTTLPTYFTYTTYSTYTSYTTEMGLQRPELFLLPVACQLA